MSTTGRMIDSGRTGLGRNAPARRRTHIGGDRAGLTVVRDATALRRAPALTRSDYRRMARTSRYRPLSKNPPSGP